jgi:high-affinity Fe2+/Pb2+ permease
MQRMPEMSSRKILLSSLLLPGSGHVWLGKAQRGLMFLFFMVMFGWLSHKLMPETASIVGRNIGAVFVYGISVIDAYRTARLRDFKK